MDVVRTVTPRSRADWRGWLTRQHAREDHVWVLYQRPEGALTYLDIVEECLCFGWIDGLAKRHEGRLAQRVSPRKPGGNWTELNKERCRKLLAAGLMTEAGRAVLPDLDVASYRPPAEVLAALQADAQAWAHWQGFPPLYQRIRAGYVEEQRTKDPAEYRRRLASLVEKTRAGKQFGNWDDSALPRTGPPLEAPQPRGGQGKKALVRRR